GLLDLFEAEELAEEAPRLGLGAWRCRQLYVVELHACSRASSASTRPSATSSAERSPCSIQSSSTPSMNHSQARTAARLAGVRSSSGTSPSRMRALVKSRIPVIVSR